MQLCNYLMVWCLLIVVTILAPIRREYKLILFGLYAAINQRMWLVLIYLTPNLPGLIAGHTEEYRASVNRLFRGCFNLKHNFYQLPDHPTIFLASYPATPLEYMAPCLLPFPVCFLTSRRAEPLLRRVYKKEEYLVFNDSKRNNYAHLREEIKNRIGTMPMYVYVEDQSQRIHDFHVGNMRKGMFYIAKELGVTITPIAIDSVLLENGLIPAQKFEIRVGATQHVEDPLQAMLDVRQFLLRGKHDFKATKFAPPSALGSSLSTGCRQPLQLRT